MQLFRSLVFLGFSCSFLSITGCQDGPLYAIKAANPYYVMGEWKDDEELGVTDHQRREELAKLAESISNLPSDRQEFWASHLSEIMEHDQSAEMRRLAARAAGGINSSSGVELLDQALEDENSKVRMEACKSLAKKRDDESARMLAATIGTETDQDVRHAAITALSSHQSPIATESLRLALDDRNPATRSLVIASLQESTGMNHGNDPKAWIAALERSEATIPTDTNSKDLSPGMPAGPFGGDTFGRVAEQPASTLNR